jgi:2-iminobutanoate/2-iminopropanoate deaminase
MARYASAMRPRPVQTDQAPAAIGPYSQAVIHNGVVYCSGQIALDPKSMELVAGGVEDQTRQVLKNLRAVLNAAGTDFDLVLRCGVFLASMDDFQAVNALYAEAFGEARPARAAIAAKTLPKGALVEIDCIAALPE